MLLRRHDDDADHDYTPPAHSHADAATCRQAVIYAIFITPLPQLRPMLPFRAADTCAAITLLPLRC
jgi:hypothetical protein